MRLNTKQIAEYTGAQVVVEALDASRLACGITWDSRDVKPDDVYLALPGNRVDGHDFVEDALYAGAAVVLIMRPIDKAVLLRAQEMGAAVLEVASTTTALTDLARAWRGFLKGKVIALSGSTGKTTTKNLVRDVLSTTYQTVATQGNQNNELGVPKTILQADPQTQYVVVEMGMRGSGQLAELCAYVKPDYALVTNTGESHIELLGSREAIVRAKAEVVQALPAGTGVAVLNCAQEESKREIEQIAQVEERHLNVIGFDGSGECRSDARVYAKDISLNAEGCPSFTLCTPEGTQTCALTLRGMHNVHNACAAAALGYVCKVPVDRIVVGLESSTPEVGRQEIAINAQGIMIIDDAYNANPDSMRAALTLFSSMKIPGRRFAVLGDMGELGSYAQACHEAIGALCARLNLDYLICVGENACAIADSAQKTGLSSERVWTVSSTGQALSVLEPLLKKDDAVLIKASHAVGLDRVARGLLN